MDTVATALEWADSLPVTESAAREAARVEATLLDRGERINLGDALIAGVCLHNGADIVTRDQHFERIDGLEVLLY